MSAWDPQRVAFAPPISTTSVSDRASVIPQTQQEEPETSSAMAWRMDCDFGARVARGPSFRAGASPYAMTRLAPIVAFAGAGALVAVVVWRLGPSYAGDLGTICDAELRSGLFMGGDMAGVTDWTRAHLSTPDGNAFYSELGDLPVAERARRLGAEASARRIPSCPLVASYGALVEGARFRADVQRLCSRVTFPDWPTVGAGERGEALERWVEAEASSPGVRALAAPLREAATPRDRARVLDEAAHGAGVLTCDSAKALLAPDPFDAAAE
jgi:hypothetical protein